MDRYLVYLYCLIGCWKYFRYLNHKSFEQLYYLGDDSKEINNLAFDPKYTDKLNAFRKTCDALVVRQRN